MFLRPPNPDLLFLGVWDFLGLFQPRQFLGVLSVFRLLLVVLQGFLGLEGAKNSLVFLGGFPWFLPKDQGMEDQGIGLDKTL